jgi:hypothetical protein
LFFISPYRPSGNRVKNQTKKSLPIALIPINLLDSKPDKQGTANNLQPTIQTEGRRTIKQIPKNRLNNKR